MTKQDAVQTGNQGNPAILIAALLGFALVLGGFGVYKYNMGKESLSWPAVRGEITYARVESRKVKNGHEYLPSVRYSYAVSGRTYAGDRINVSAVYLKTQSRANEALRKYPVGGEVPVYYNPADPGKSLLETGVKMNIYVMLGAAAFCLFLAMAITVSALKKKKPAVE